MYKVNKQKCVGCQVCLRACPGAIKIGIDGKAEVVDQEKLEQCGGEKICPMGAIEKVSDEKNKGAEFSQKSQSIPNESASAYPPDTPSSFGGRGLGRGRGPGRGRGRGQRLRGRR